jgi:hypothetical protein
MLNENTIRSVQENILNSREFAGSQKNKNLLLFLINSYLKNEIPKETTIALEVLERGVDFNSSDDPIVRVQMHNLRAKLDSYYNSEGINDKIRLKIPRGHYAIEFEAKGDHQESSRPKILQSKKTYASLGCIIAVLTCAILIVDLCQKNNEMQQKLDYYQIVDETTPIWNDFLQNDIQTDIVLGNHFFYNEYSEEMKKWRYVRDLRINTDEDLENLKNQFPNRQIINTNEAYFPDGSVWCIPPIIELFYSAQKSIEFRRVKDTSPQSIYNNNVIFLGSIKTLGIFDQYISGSHFRYELMPHTPFRTERTTTSANDVDTHKLIYSPPNSTEKDTIWTNYNQSTGYHRDLAIALKFPGPNDNFIFIITSFYSSGVPEVTKYLADPTNLKVLENHFKPTCDEIPQYFEILFEFRGV